MKKYKNHQSWSYIFIISFFVLSIIDFRFGILGFVCMLMPIYQAIRGRGKLHCSKHCPRGSFLGKFLNKISFRNNLPSFMRTNSFKNIIVTLMIIVFSISLATAEFTLVSIGFIVFRFMFVSFIVGVVIGIIYKPRSWCQICPMGHATGLISKKKS